MDAIFSVSFFSANAGRRFNTIEKHHPVGFVDDTVRFAQLLMHHTLRRDPIGKNVSWHNS